MFCACDHDRPCRITRYALALILSAGALTLAFTATPSAARAEQAPATQPTTKPTAINKQCPVNPDHAVDPKAPTVTYKGKVIGFCCEDCIEDFNKDPEKYMKDLK